MQAYASEKPPPYTVGGRDEQDITEEKAACCAPHGDLETRLIYASTHKTRTRSCLHGSNTTLEDVAAVNSCIKCAIKNAAFVLTAYTRVIRASKPKRQWSKADKRALKAEVKGFLREIERDVKQTWRMRPENQP